VKNHWKNTVIFPVEMKVQRVSGMSGLFQLMIMMSGMSGMSGLFQTGKPKTRYFQEKMAKRCQGCQGVRVVPTPFI